MDLKPVSDKEIENFRFCPDSSPCSVCELLKRLLADRARVKKFLLVDIGIDEARQRWRAHFGRIKNNGFYNKREHVYFDWSHPHNPNFAEAIHAIEEQAGKEGDDEGSEHQTAVG